MSVHKAISLAVISALLVIVSFPPISAVPLVFVAFMPLLVAARDLRTRARFLSGWLCGLVAVGGAFHWLWASIAASQHLSSLAALPFFVVFTLYHALPFALVAVAASVASPSQVASVWVVVEALLPTVFPWSLGDALAPSDVLRQVADLGGPLGLSWVIVYCNASIAEAMGPRANGRTVGAYAFRVGATLAVVIAYGIVASAAWRSAGGERIAIATVQGQLPSGRTDLEQANVEAIETYSALTTGIDATDLILWPETTLRVYLADDAGYRRRVQEVVDARHTPLLLGSLDLSPDRAYELNTAYLVSPDTFDMQRYHKKKLLTFGEYVPAASWLAHFGDWRTTGRFIAGESSGPATMTATLAPRGSHPVVIAPSICLEALRHGVFNDAVRQGAQVLVNLTDDGWFAPAWEPALHLNGVRLRAVETRRALVRASNSGVSAFIAPDGTIAESLPTGTKGVLQGSVPLATGSSLYVHLGDWPLALSVAVLLTGISRRIAFPVGFPRRH